MNNEIEAVAAEWAVRLRLGALEDSAQQELDAWLACDARHMGALVRARARWQDLDRMAALLAHDPERLNALAPAAPVQEPARPRWTRRGLLTAGLGGLGALGLGWSLLAPAGDYYSTAVGEVRRIALEDGSTLVLNTDSEARVRFEPHERSVELLRGEALFEVAHDAQRPFIVSAQHWQVRAIGTVFDLRLRADDLEVTVSEGEVELSGAQRGADASTPQRVRAHENLQLAASRTERRAELSSQRLEQRFAWMNGMVVFSGEPLSEAVEEINRHNHRKLVIDDATLAAQPVVGAFRATDPEGFGATAAAALDCEAVEAGGAVHLRNRSH